MRPSCLVGLASVLLARLVSAAIGPVGDLTIVNKQLAPDGYQRRYALGGSFGELFIDVSSSTVVAGDTFPGPLIRGNKGDNFQINVHNNLTDTSMDLVTSVHWHGIDMHHTSFMDGVPFVTQCPIVPGGSYLYNFTTREQAGTFWYHSHYSGQYCDGLRGPLVIYDPEDPHKDLYDVDDESTVITLSDWYHYMSPNAPAIPSPSSALINGKGRCIDNGTTLADSSLAVISVEPGKRYRFRLLSMSCDSNFVFSIDRHPMTIIEVDGSNVEPLKVDSITIYPAQRYSFILEANQHADNYCEPLSSSVLIARAYSVLPGMRSLPSAPIAQTTNSGVNSAILRYRGAPHTRPATKQVNSTLPLVETNLHPLVPSPVPGKPKYGGVDKSIRLDVTFDGKIFLVNNVTYASPEVPILLQILSGTTKPQELLPSGSIYGLKRNQTVEVTIPGGVISLAHPIHLHGHSFYVVKSAGNSSFNFENPVLRDTVAMGAEEGDDIVIRFVTDNPGPWIIHCHIDWHLSVGFAAVMVEDIEDMAADQDVPESWKQLCPAYDAFTNKTKGK
ncbi:hypothetical protein EWM64_g8147 [Hericium alpestre]|uniref:Laccase n=1 Tax=Hericium alpestre TaxID=135208 RepID=A0A4Y9ZNM6_9AGAM|nr:hypothetical protein EWM64_g8147 [Hericium alpestre]